MLNSKRQLQFSNTYNICLKRLLNQEVSNKRKLVRTTKQKLTSMKDALHHEMKRGDQESFLLLLKMRVAGNGLISNQLQRFSVMLKD